MKVIKPFFFGVLGGLAMALALTVGLYFSPMREDLYFQVDPEVADIRSKLGQYREWLAQTDFRIAAGEKGLTGDGKAADSLRNAQTKAWRDYKGWRNRLGDLARAHSKPTAAAFWPWVHSLRYWLGPMAIAFALLPGVVFALRSRFRGRPGRVKPQAKSSAEKNSAGKTPRAQALSNFEDAIKKVARISESERGNTTIPLPPDPRPPVQPAHRFQKGPASPPPVHADDEFQSGRSSKRPAREEPPTAPLPTTDMEKPASPDPVVGGPKRNEPDTVPIPIPAPGEEPESRPKTERLDLGRETAFLNVGPGWGGTVSQPGERIGDPSSGTPRGPADPVGARNDLSMEDEDAGEDTLGVMPPTTEVERVERRKAEVLKLARKGMTSSEISRRMRISQDQVEFIIRLRREKG
jgi:hypothetical protein